MLGDLLFDTVARQPWSGRIDAVVPIPQPWTRSIARRSFPVGNLADRVAVRLGVPVWPILAARLHRRQVGLGVQERLKNVRGVFRVRRGIDLAGCRLCLIDDVSTTGATLENATRTLRRSGAAAVYAAAIAKAG